MTHNTQKSILVIVIAVVIAIAAWYVFFAKRAEKFVPYSELAPAAREAIFESLRAPAPSDGASAPSAQALERLRGKNAPPISDAEQQQVLKSLTPP